MGRLFRAVVVDGLVGLSSQQGARHNAAAAAARLTAQRQAREDVDAFLAARNARGGRTGTRG